MFWKPTEKQIDETITSLDINEKRFWLGVTSSTVGLLTAFILMLGGCLLVRAVFHVDMNIKHTVGTFTPLAWALLMSFIVPLVQAWKGNKPKCWQLGRIILWRFTVRFIGAIGGCMIAIQLANYLSAALFSDTSHYRLSLFWASILVYVMWLNASSDVDFEKKVKQ